MSVDRLKAEALRLDPEARACLARVLLASLDGMSSAETEKLWVDEAIARDEELSSGSLPVRIQATRCLPERGRVGHDARLLGP